ncbi:phosphatase PAP2 family protein [Dyadobacter sandarakinus]|nr:phosphatase PAP2 family protein [Dyadobacter sandarakinus]
MPPAALAQQDTTLRHIQAADVVPPVSLALAGLITQGRISRALHERVRAEFPNFRTHADDYLLYAPGVVSLGLAASGVKGKHGLKDQIILAIISNLAVQGVTQGMKRIIAYPRPNGEDYRSFPSGHSSTAFTNATLLHEEYGDRSIWYTVGGYGTATTVGALRMLNNKHWLADVLMGAGVGIGATKAIYISYPWVQRQVRRVKNR